MNQDDFENGNCAYAQFLQIQKNQLNDLLEHSEWDWNVLYLFGFNSAIFDPILIESILPLILVLWTKETLNPLTSKKRNISPRSKMVLFNYSI